jgi:CheY-like chemotaxis protein
MQGDWNENDVTILLAEDDDGHAKLVRMHFEESGVRNEIIRLKDGQEALDFFYDSATTPKYEPGRSYLLLLDIRMPRVDGVEVLRRLKSDANLSRMPIVMLTTTDDPREIEACYKLGCNVYITKPISFTAFAETLRRFGLFLKVIRVAPLA